MEDVLDLYEEEYDPCYPLVCLDEKLVAPHADVRSPQPLLQGDAECIDYEYERLGTASLFFMGKPQAGWRHVEMTERRTKRDYAKQSEVAGRSRLSRGRVCAYLLSPG